MATFGAAGPGTASGDPLFTLVHTPGNPLFPTLFDPTNARKPFYPFPSGEPSSAALQLFAGLYGPLTTHGAIRGELFADWYLNQWWISPRPVEFGNIAGEKRIDAAILSTWEGAPNTLDAINLAAVQPGVTLSGVSLPVSIGFLEAIAFEIVAAAVGLPTFDAEIQYQFSNVSLGVQYSGQRIVIFWFHPEGGLQEQLGWKTRVIKRRDGTEQRQALRLYPRQTITETIVQTEDNVHEVSYLRTILQALRAFPFGIPIWWEQQYLTQNSSAGTSTVTVEDTATRDFRVGGSVMLFNPQTRVIEDKVILSMTPTTITFDDTLANSVTTAWLIMPLRFGHIVRDPVYRDNIVNRYETQVTFEIYENADLAFETPSDLTAAGFITHTDGLPILSDPNMLQGTRQSRGTSMRIERIDPGIGLPTQASLEPKMELTSSKGVPLHTLADIRRWRSLLHWLRGSYDEFYLPTFRNDLVPVQQFGLDDTTIRVLSNTGTFVGTIKPHTLVMLEILATGEQYFSAVSDMAPTATEGQDDMLLTPGFDPLDMTTYQPDEVRISWCELVRIDGDVATFIHNFVGDSILRFNVKTLQ